MTVITIRPTVSLATRIRSFFASSEEPLNGALDDYRAPIDLDDDPALVGYVMRSGAVDLDRVVVFVEH